MNLHKSLRLMIGIVLTAVFLNACGAPAINPSTATPSSVSSAFPYLLAGESTVSTTATDFVDMPDMTASILVSESTPTCIIATFSGMFQAGKGGVTGNGSVHLRVLLDETLMEGHDDVDELVEPILAGFNIFRSYTFWKCDVASGTHTVRIQWHTHMGAPALASRARTLVVEGK
jgi:hypothetical protein